MAMRRPPNSPAGSGQATNQQVFKPKDSVLKFSKIFPGLYAIFGAVFVAALVAGVWTGFYLVPVMVAFPILGTVIAGTYASRLSRSRIVIDGERLRIVQGNKVQANLPWGQITKLTIRKEREEDLYEMWVKESPIPLPAAFYNDGDKLIMAVSARTNKPWVRA